MSKHKHSKCLKRKFEAKDDFEDKFEDDIEDDMEGDIEDDSDDEDYNFEDEVRNLKRFHDDLEENDLIEKSSTNKSSMNPEEKAIQKCHQIAISIRSALISTTLATKDLAQIASNNEKLVLKATLNAACEIPMDDTNRDIKPYQISGINFLLLLHRLHIGGAILADEMGLGKTMQTIAFLAVLKSMHGDLGPHLVVAPTSVLEGWKREFTKWCPFFDVIVYHGNERAFLSKKLLGVGERRERAPFNVLITSYSTFEKQGRQMKKDRKFLKLWNWSCVIMDEGHLLKDATSHRNNTLKNIACKAKQQIMLTGTPVQNNLQELWSLLNFMMPNIFDACKDNIYEFIRTKNHGRHEQSLISNIQTILKPLVLRRTKSEVLSQLLQPKDQHVLRVDMVDAQAMSYEEALLEWHTYEKMKSTNEENLSKPQKIINIFSDLRKVSNHPLLVRRIYTNEMVKKLAKEFHHLQVFGNNCTEEQICNELLTFNDFSLHRLCEEFGGILDGQGKLPNELALSSAKCQQLVKLLPQLKRDGHRCLIFSQWTTILDILEWALNVLGYKFIRLDGTTDVAKRQTLVDEYNNNTEIFIFFISTRAGGQGLNLIGADTVIIHDVDFNPQIDRQAEDRCHRIGQKKPVTVYRLVTRGTVDEGIFNIAQNKLNLDTAVLHTRHESSNEIELPDMVQILSRHMCI